MKVLMMLILCLLSTGMIYAQNQTADADFMRKISPEKKIDLSQRVEKTPQASQKVVMTKEELKETIAHLETQKANLTKEIARLEAEGVSPKDAHYAKCKMAEKYIDHQLADQHKHLAAQERKKQ
jgi:uncharacterized protein (DUF488 family)